MAAKKFKDGDIEKELFKDFYVLFQAHLIPEPNDDYWDALYKNFEIFREKYKTTNYGEFAYDLSLSFVKMIDKKARE